MVDSISCLPAGFFLLNQEYLLIIRTSLRNRQESRLGFAMSGTELVTIPTQTEIQFCRELIRNPVKHTEQIKHI
jgi:hypothetical protein